MVFKAGFGENKEDEVKQADETISPASDKTNITQVQEGVEAIVNVLRTGSHQQRYDAAKAIGYIARTGLLTAKNKLDCQNAISDILINEQPGISLAFALLEALQRVSEDAFWSLVISWYSQSVRTSSDSLRLPTYGKPELKD